MRTACNPTKSFSFFVFFSYFPLFCCWSYIRYVLGAAGCRCACVSRFLISSQVVLIFVMDFCASALILHSNQYSVSWSPYLCQYFGWLENFLRQRCWYTFPLTRMRHPTHSEHQLYYLFIVFWVQKKKKYCEFNLVADVRTIWLFQ